MSNMTLFFILISILSSWANASDLPFPANPYQLVPNATSRNRIGKVANLPAVIDIHNSSLCSSSTGYYLIQHFVCDLNPEKYDCANLSNEQKISVLELAGAKQTYLGSRSAEELQKLLANGYSKTPRINLYQGGNFFSVLDYARLENELRPEACAPIDQFLNKFSSLSLDTEQVSTLFEEKFKRLRTAIVEGSSECVECLLQDLSFGSYNFQNQRERDRLVNMVKLSKDFGRYLYFSTVVACTKATIKLPVKPDLNYFPRDGQTVTRLELANKIRAVLKDGRPLGITGICTVNASKNPEDCKTWHDMTIVDYDEACVPDGRCFPRVRVLEPYGEKRQQLLNDGWISLDALLAHMNLPTKEPTLAWLTVPHEYQMAQTK